MSKEANLETAQNMGKAIHLGHLEELSYYFAPNVVDHDPAPDQGKGPEGFIKFFTGFRSAFPDLAISVDHMVTDDDNVSMAYTIKGTHNGNFMGIPPTGKKIHVRGMQIARFENAKIVERWGSSDQLGILQQIGAVKGIESATQLPAITSHQL